MTAIQKQILNEIIQERYNQTEKWGEQNHIPSAWTDILMEEVGEVSRAILEAVFGDGSWDDYRKELIQVAAVAVSMVECLDRERGNSKCTDAEDVKNG